jgi:transcriptional regulator with XRE-family HTH domain
MQVIAQWTGGQADKLRQALRMTIEKFAERLDMSPRAVADWRSHPGIVPRSHVQRTLDSMLERAPDRVKEQFALLIGEGRDAQGSNDTESNNEPLGIDAALALPESSNLVLPYFRESARLQQAATDDVVDVLSRIQRLRKGAVHPEIISQLEGNIQDTIAQYERLDHSSLLPTLLKQRAWEKKFLVSAAIQHSVSSY